MKKMLLAALSACTLCACTQAAPAVSADNPVEKAVAAVQKNPGQDSALDLYALLFDASSKGYDNQFVITKENNGNIINFLNADELVQMNSTDVSDYKDILTFYDANSTFYSITQVSGETLEASRSQDGTQDMFSAHGYGDDEWKVFASQSQPAQTVQESADTLWSELLSIEPLLSNTMYLCPLNNAAYYTFDLTKADDGLQLQISISDPKAFAKENLSQIAAAGYNTDFFDVFDIEEDTYTLTMTAEGKITGAAHVCTSKYTINGIEKKESLSSSTTVASAKDFDTDFYSQLFERIFGSEKEDNVAFNLPE